MLPGANLRPARPCQQHLHDVVSDDSGLANFAPFVRKRVRLAISTLSPFLFAGLSHARFTDNG